MKSSGTLFLATIALALAGAVAADVSHPSDSLARIGTMLAGTDCGNELFNNGPLATSTGDGPGGSDVSLLQNVSLSLTSLGTDAYLDGDGPHNRMADDFTLLAEAELRCLLLYAYQTNSTTTSTITSANIRLWDGPPGAVGSSVVFGDATTNRMLDTGWTGIYRFAENNVGNTQRPLMWVSVDLDATVLSSGTYWIDWQAAGSLASGPWAPPISIIGEATTGDARRLRSDGWETHIDESLGTPQGIPFVVFGIGDLFHDRFEE